MENDFEISIYKIQPLRENIPILQKMITEEPALKLLQDFIFARFSEATLRRESHEFFDKKIDYENSDFEYLSKTCFLQEKK